MANEVSEKASYGSYVECFKKEFNDLFRRFEPSDLFNAKEVYEIWRAKDQATKTYPSKKPGVYVYWKIIGDEYTCLRVGKSRVDVFGRAMQHIRDETQTKDGSIKISQHTPNLFVVLFSIDNKKDIHWVLALEDFFEEILKPSIPSRRG